jgi:hypothetical protein
LILAMAATAVAAPLSVVAGFRGAAASSFQPLQPRARPVAVRASMKEKVSAGLTAAGVATALVMPDVADAVVKNFLLSIVSGGVVLVAIVGAVSNFDPVKRT